MGYLQKSDGIADFAQAVISFWFRVPAATLTAARAQFLATWNDTGTYDPNLIGKIPLLTFGGAATSPETGQNLGRSFIGINCGHFSVINGGVPVDSPNFIARLQYLRNEAAGLTSDTGTNPDYFAIGYDAEFGGHATVTNTSPQVKTIRPDQWHHAIVSFDMTPGCATAPDAFSPNFTRACKFWLALDDANFDAGYLYPAYPGCYQASTGSRNDIGSSWCLYYVDSLTGDPLAQSFSAGNLPAVTYPIGIPAGASDVSHIYRVDMAEMQFFAGVTLDTSVQANRRLFVTSSRTPEAAPVAEAALGKPPDIYLHGQTNWQGGINLGTVGNFIPTGTINPFSPGPSF